MAVTNASVIGAFFDWDLSHWAVTFGFVAEGKPGVGSGSVRAKEDLHLVRSSDEGRQRRNVPTEGSKHTRGGFNLVGGEAKNATSHRRVESEKKSPAMCFICPCAN